MAWLRCEKHLINYNSTLGCPKCSNEKPTRKDLESGIEELEARLKHLNDLTRQKYDDPFGFEITTPNVPRWYKDITSYKATSTEKTLPKDFGSKPKDTSGTLPKGFILSESDKAKLKKPKKPSLFKQILLGLKIAEVKKE